MKTHEVFSTTADVGIRIWGKTYAQLYSNAITGFNALVFGENRLQKFYNNHIAYRFEYRGDSCENVLVNLLTELVFLLYSEHRVSAGIDIKIADRNVFSAELFLQPVSNEPEIEIKSVTYHNLHIKNTRGIKSAEIVFDI